MSTRVAIYVRVSTEEQSHKDLSIPFQLDACRAHAEREGWEVAGVYTDIGSAKTDRREHFQRLISDARSRLFDHVLVFKYSRFARNDTDAVLYEAELAKKGVTLISATEALDATTSTGWLSKRILQTLAEFENKQKAEYVRAGMKQRLLGGEWSWRAPLGYLNRREDLGGKRFRKWVEQDPNTAPLVTRMFEEAATGRRSMPELCDIAEDMGLQTAYGRGFTSEKVLRLLRNPFYKGTMTSPKFEVEVKGTYEALVDEELWDRVQAMLAVRGKAPYKTHRHKHLLRGLVMCACGMRMTAEFHDDGRNAYLRCVTSASPRLKTCGQPLVRIDAVVRQITEEIIPSLWVSDEDLESVRDELRALLATDHHALEAEVHILKTRLAHMKGRSERLLELRLDGEVTREEFQGKKTALDLDQARATHKLLQTESLITQGEDDLGRALELANKLPQLWAEADEQGRRELLETVFVRFVMDGREVARSELRAPFSWLGALGQSRALLRATDGLILGL